MLFSAMPLRTALYLWFSLNEQSILNAVLRYYAFLRCFSADMNFMGHIYRIQWSPGYFNVRRVCHPA